MRGCPPDPVWRLAALRPPLVTVELPFHKSKWGQHPLRSQMKLLQTRRPRTEAQTQTQLGRARRPPPRSRAGPAPAQQTRENTASEDAVCSSGLQDEPCNRYTEGRVKTTKAWTGSREQTRGCGKGTRDVGPSPQGGGALGLRFTGCFPSAHRAQPRQPPPWGQRWGRLSIKTLARASRVAGFRGA